LPYLLFSDLNNHATPFGGVCLRKAGRDMKTELV
jgi:hypothetical protein